MSLWAATAQNPAPEAPPLAGAARADVAVVGGGYTGLAAALALAEAGASVRVLEAEEIGAGASGRNGGQVIPGLKVDPDALDRLLGEAATAFVGEAADTTFALIARLGIACGAARTGWIQASAKRAHLDAVAARAEQWRRRGAPVETLDAAEMARRTGAHRFVGGWRDGRAGVLHPLDYARGLGAAAQRAGAVLHSGSRALRIARAARGWRVVTARGGVTAERVLLAGNGYSDALWPGVKETVLPARSCQIATTPLSEQALAGALPGGEAVSETRRIGVYFRRGPSGRLLIGGRGPFGEPRAAHFETLRRALVDLYPQAAEARIEHAWSGRVAMTADHLPHIHAPAPGVLAALGYNGRGVAMATALGLALGAHLADAGRPLPWPPAPLHKLPLHGLHEIYGGLAIRYYRLRDALDT